VTRLLNTLSLPREGGGDGNELLIALSPDRDSDCRLRFDCAGRVFDAGVGLDIISSASRLGRFPSRGESGEGVFRSGEEERGDETCGVYVESVWA